MPPEIKESLKKMLSNLGIFFLSLALIISFINLFFILKN